MKIIPLLDATAPDVIVGRHSVWAPELGLKVPFQWGGKVTKYDRLEDGYDPTDSLPHELAVLRALAGQGMAPPIGEVVFIETLITERPGAWHADPVGAWGYEMADATKLPPGRFSFEKMREFPILGSEGAWGDVAKPGNVVNGYLVDVRRSAWDMLWWDTAHCVGGDALMPRIPERIVDRSLLARVHRECQFPAGEREIAYQDFWLGGARQRGQRRVIERAEAIGFIPCPGDTVLDIGCQAGGFLQFATASGATAVGVEVNPIYVDCARALARSCQQNICIREMDVVRERDAFLAWVRAYFPRGVTHCLALSLEKHVGEKFLFDLLDAIGARRTYVETNAVSETNPMKLWPFVEARGGRHVGNSNDRNLRRLYRMESNVV